VTSDQFLYFFYDVDRPPTYLGHSNLIPNGQTVWRRSRSSSSADARRHSPALLGSLRAPERSHRLEWHGRGAQIRRRGCSRSARAVIR